MDAAEILEQLKSIMVGRLKFDARRATGLGPATAGEQLKARKEHDPSWDGTDAVGFTALPGGIAFRGAFGDAQQSGRFL